VALEAGTSLSSPMFAGIQALIDQGLAGAGLSPSQGSAAPTLYALAAHEFGGAGGGAPATLSTCNADNGTKGTAKCVFHNITSGGNSTQCIQIQAFGDVTPDCYFYGTIANYEEFYGATLVGLTSTSTSKYYNNTATFAAQPGWSFLPTAWVRSMPTTCLPHGRSLSTSIEGRNPRSMMD
jgi:subtilase family serine protease